MNLMNQLFVFSILLLGLFLISCTKENLPHEEGFEEQTLTGQTVFTTVTNCDKSFDSQPNKFIQGTLIFTKRGKTYSYTDKCYTSNKLLEYSCKGGTKVSRQLIPCNQGCKEGSCMKDISQETCTNSCIISYELGDTKETVSLPLGKIAMLKNKAFFDQLYIEVTEAFELTNNYCKLSTHFCSTKEGDYECEKSDLKLFLSKQEGNANLGSFTLEGIKCDNFKYEMYKNGVSIENSGVKTYPPKVLSCMDSDYDGIYTKETVVEYTQEKDGSASKKEYTDSCSNENTLKEFVCTNGVAKSKIINCQQGCNEEACGSGNLNVVGMKSLLPESPPIPDLKYPLDNELEITSTQLSSGKIKVIVPEGYEAYGQKMLTDLEYCSNLVPQFLGISPYWGEVGAKVYISKDGSNLGSYGEGWLFYKKSQVNIDMNLQDVKENNSNDFLFKSSPEYCGNSHEFTHYVVDQTIIPTWADEGIAEYTQKTTQKGSKDHFECQENGHYGQDTWGDSANLVLFPYLDLSESPGSEFGTGAKWYRTALCFWEFFDNKFSKEKREEAFQLLRNKYTAELDKYQTYKLKDGTLISVPDKTSFFIENVLFEIVNKSELKPLLSKFGFEEGIDYE